MELATGETIGWTTVGLTAALAGTATVLAILTNTPGSCSAGPRPASKLDAQKKSRRNHENPKRPDDGSHDSSVQKGYPRLYHEHLASTDKGDDLDRGLKAVEVADVVGHQSIDPRGLCLGEDPRVVYGASADR